METIENWADPVGDREKLPCFEESIRDDFGHATAIACVVPLSELGSPRDLFVKLQRLFADGIADTHQDRNYPSRGFTRTSKIRFFGFDGENRTPNPEPRDPNVMVLTLH